MIVIKCSELKLYQRYSLLCESCDISLKIGNEENEYRNNFDLKKVVAVHTCIVSLQGLWPRPMTAYLVFCTMKEPRASLNSQGFERF